MLSPKERKIRKGYLGETVSQKKKKKKRKKKKEVKRKNDFLVINIVLHRCWN